MTFHVDPPAVARFGDRLDELAKAAETAKEYAEHTRPEVEGDSLAAIVRFLNSCQEVRPAVEDFFSHLRTLTDESGRELHRTAQRYAALDSAARARLDAAYPGR